MAKFKYRVKSGIHFDADNRKCASGDVVELDEREAKNFPDRFEKVEDSPVTIQSKEKEKDEDKLVTGEELTIGPIHRAPAEEKSTVKTKPVRPPMQEKGKPHAAKDEILVNKDEPKAAKDMDDDDGGDDGDGDDGCEEATMSKAQKRATTLGDDKTVKFPAAKKKGLTVHLTDEGDYQIAKKGKIVEGGESLSRGKVSTFIKKFKVKD